MLRKPQSNFRIYVVIVISLILVLGAIAAGFGFSKIGTLNNDVDRIIDLLPVCRKNCNKFGRSCTVDADCVPVNGKTGVSVAAVCTPNFQCAYKYFPPGMFAPPVSVIPLGPLADAFCRKALSNDVYPCFTAAGIDVGTIMNTSPTGIAGGCLAVSPCSSLPDNAFATRAERSLLLDREFLEAVGVLMNKK